MSEPAEAASSEAASSKAAECVFAVRLVQIDVVLEKPQDGLDHTRSNLTGQPLGRVPVIRVFGSTPRGQTACLHVHGVYRYFLVPFDGEPPSDPHALSVQLKALAKELNDALGNGPSMLGHSRERVFDMTVVHRTPFYGYHAEPRPFVRIALVEPSDVEEAAALFARGGLAGRGAAQPFEAHIPHLLQFKIDHNLLGMDFVRLGHVGSVPPSFRGGL